MTKVIASIESRIRISELAYDWLVGMPWFSPNGYSGSQNQTVTITEETPGATTHYTLNGDDPTDSDPTIASGAQFVSTDYPLPGMSDRWGTDYVVRLPEGRTVRCNPVSAPPDCDSASLEDL